MSIYLYKDNATELYVFKYKGFVFNPKPGSMMLIERESDGFVNLQAVYDNRAFRQNTNGHILNDFVDPELILDGSDTAYGPAASDILAALSDFFVDAPALSGATDLLGGIAHNAAAPTPGVSGKYYFTSAGVVSWITGTPTIAIGDEVIVVYNDPDYTYTHLPVGAQLDLKFDKANLESTRSQSTTKVPSSKLMDDELKLKVDILPGKNILNPKEIELNKAINTSGVIISAAGADLSPKLYFNGNPSITCNCCIPSGGYSFIAVYKGDNTFIGGVYSGGAVKTINAADYPEAAYVRFPLTQTTERQAEYDIEATPYIEYNQFGLYIEELDTEKVDISIGKNILDPDKVLIGKAINTSGVIIPATGVDVTPKLYFNGNPSITCNSCKVGGGYSFFAVYKADNTFIAGNYCLNVVTTINAADYPEAAYVRFPMTQTVERQVEYNIKATAFRAFNPVGSYVEYIKDEVELTNENVDFKVNFNPGVNLIDINQVTWGRAIVPGGAIVDSNASYGLSQKLYFNGHASLISRAISSACSSGYAISYYKADGTYLSTARPLTPTIPAITDAAYIIASVDWSYKDYDFKVEYTDVKSKFVDIAYNPIGRFTDDTPISLYAYADGDATPDADGSFYGNKGYWKAWHDSVSDQTYYTIDDIPVVNSTKTYSSTINHGFAYKVVKFYNAVTGISFDNVTYFVRDSSKDLNVGAIQRAINSCEDGRKYIIYCKGHFLFNTVAQFAGNRSSLYAMVWMQNKNITLQGEGINKTIIEVDLPDNLGVDFPYYDYSPVEFADGEINDISIIGHNCRYAIHSVGGKNVNINRVLMWHKENTGDAAVAWSSLCTFGIGTGEATIIKVKDSDIVDEGYPLYIHDNNGQEQPYHFSVQDSRLLCKNTTQGVLPVIATLFNLNAPSQGTFELKNVSLGNRRVIRVGHDSSYSKVNVFPEIFTRIIGDIKVPIHYDYVVEIGKVLKITSSTTGVESTVRINTASTAFEKLMKGNTITDFETPRGLIHSGNYRYFDGAVGLNGWACGELAIDPGTSGSMQTRLGDCTSAPKSLIVTIDGVEKTIIFDQDYTGYSDANMLAVINNAIGSAGIAELYILGSEYYPELNQIVENLPNNSASTILRGMGVKIADGTISAATTNSEVNGIALDDIKIGYIGRVTTKAYLPTVEKRFKIKLSVQESCSAGDKFKISSTPGIFEKDNATGVFVADYNSIVKFDL